MALPHLRIQVYPVPTLAARRACELQDKRPPQILPGGFNIKAKDAFDRARAVLLERLASRLGAVIDETQYLRIDRVPPEAFAERLKRIAAASAQEPELDHLSISAGTDYTQEERLNARYLLMGAHGWECDEPTKGWEGYAGPRNGFTRMECAVCGRPDFSTVRSPFLANGKIARRSRRCRYSIHYCSNGIRVLSTTLWDILPDDVRACLHSGPVAFFDAPDETLPEFRWIRPRFHLGSYWNRVEEMNCVACRGPVVIHKQAGGARYLVHNLNVLEDMTADYPLALTGNWFGHLDGTASPRVVWDTAISGAFARWLLEKKVFQFVVDEDTEVFHDKADLSAAEGLADCLAAVTS